MFDFVVCIKYALVAPGVIHSIYLFLVNDEEKDLFYLLIFPFMLWRMLHNLIWISYSRYKTGKGKNLIVEKGIDFEQVDREKNWYTSYTTYYFKLSILWILDTICCKWWSTRDDQILFNWIIMYAVYWVLKGVRHTPLWRLDGFLLTFLLHFTVVEFFYYWLHRALHHHYLYSRYHSHHHSSFVTEPITCKKNILN